MIKPVMTGATGTVTKCLQKHLEAVTGNCWIDSVQNTVVVGTSHIIRKVLQSETWTLSVGITVFSRKVPGRKGLWYVATYFFFLFFFFFFFFLLLLLLLLLVCSGKVKKWDMVLEVKLFSFTNLRSRYMCAHRTAILVWYILLFKHFQTAILVL